MRLVSDRKLHVACHFYPYPFIDFVSKFKLNLLFRHVILLKLVGATLVVFQHGVET